MFAVPSFFGYNTTFVSTPVATAATGVGETSFTANWNAFSGASYYLLDVSLSSSFSSFVLQDTVTTATSYVVTGLTASTTYYYRIRAAINVDSDVAGFVSRVYTAGGTLSYTEVTATETLVADLKGYGIWTAMKAVYPMVGGGTGTTAARQAACEQNLKSSSFTGTFTSGWTFASNGITPNGTSAYMDTGLNASSNLTTSNAHFSLYINNFINNSNDRINGAYPGIFMDQYNNTNVYYGVGAEADVNATNQIGLLQVNALANLIFYKNGTNLKSTSTGGSLPSKTLFLGASNMGSGGQYWWGGRISFSSIGDGLTDTQASNFYTAVQAFNTTLSRQV